MPSTNFNINHILNGLTYINITKAVIITLVGIIAANTTSKIISKASKKYAVAAHLNVIKKVLFYLILFIFVLSALQQLGFNLSAILGAAGIFTVAIGIAAQTSAANLVSGLFLLFDRSFKLGDTICVDNITGTVVSIDTLSIKLATSNNQFVRIPNDSLIKTNIINLSHYKTRRYDLDISVAYETDLKIVQGIMLSVANKNAYSLDKPSSGINILGFDNSAINLRLSAWATNENYRNLADSLQAEIKIAFENNAISMPLLSQNIHITNPLPINLEVKS